MLKATGRYVHVSRRGPASWARIDRPDRGNACGPEVMAALEEWLATEGDDPGVRALVITGTGKAFCAGADMRAGAELQADPVAHAAYLRRGRDLVDAIAGAPRPVVAAVNGVAYAGGFEIVLAADFVVAARSARLGDRHARHGIVPGWGSTVRLPVLLGARRAAELLLTGDDLRAEELERLGLVNAVVDDECLVDGVDRLVERLAAVDPAAASRILGLLRARADRSGAEARDAEWETLTEHVCDPAFAAVVERFFGR